MLDYRASDNWSARDSTFNLSYGRLVLVIEDREDQFLCLPNSYIMTKEDLTFKSKALAELQGQLMMSQRKSREVT